SSFTPRDARRDSARTPHSSPSRRATTSSLSPSPMGRERNPSVREVPLPDEPRLRRTDGPPPSLTRVEPNVIPVPPIEKPPARVHVERTRSIALHAVMHVVLEEVRKAVPGFARRLQIMSVVAISPYLSPAAEQQVEAPRKRNRKAA